MFVRSVGTDPLFCSIKDLLIRVLLSFSQHTHPPSISTKSLNQTKPIISIMPNYAHDAPNASNTGSWRTFGSRRKRDVASNYPLDASFLIMDDDDDYSFAAGIWPASATARVKAFFSPRSRGSTSPLSSRGASANTSPSTSSPLAQTPNKGFKAKFTNACRLFKPNTGYSPMKEDKKLQRVVHYEAPCPIVEAKQERKWANLAAERQKQVDILKREARKRKAKEARKRLVVESGPYAGWTVDKHPDVRGPGDVPPIWAGIAIGHYHDGQAIRQCRLSQIGLDA